MDTCLNQGFFRVIFMYRICITATLIPFVIFSFFHDLPVRCSVSVVGTCQVIS